MGKLLSMFKKYAMGDLLISEERKLVANLMDMYGSPLSGP